MDNKVIQNDNDGTMHIGNIKTSPRVIGIIVGVILLPALLIGVYVMQTFNSRAAAGCPAENVKAERISNSSGSVSFTTNCSVKAQIYCAVGEDGVQFLCGEDEIESVNHNITTSTDITLSSDVAYYVYIDTGLEDRTPAFIPASADDKTVGIDFNSFNTETLGLEEGDEEFNVTFDLNQDGVVNMHDRAEFYDEFQSN